MKSKRLEALFVGFFYLVLQGLRLLHLSSLTGAFVHNLFYCVVLKKFATQGESRKLHLLLRKSFTYDGAAMIRWQRRVYESAPKVVRYTLRNVFARRYLINGLRRRKQDAIGQPIPSHILISVSTPDIGCNKECTHCYASGQQTAILPIEKFRKILDEQEQCGIYSVRLLGGEPFLYEGIWEIFSEYPNTTMQVATNGTRMTKENVSRLVELGNIFPIISLEGFEKNTDAIRGERSFSQVKQAMQNCKEQLLPFGVIVTVMRQNFREVTGEAFLKFLDSMRCVSIGYSCYVPMGEDTHPEWQLTMAESRQLDKTAELIYRKFAMMPIIGRNGTDRVNDCPAAREFIHYLPNGQVESCPFAQMADFRYNASTHTITEIMASPLFQKIREFNKLEIAGATPCQVGKLKSLGGMYAELGARPTSTSVTLPVFDFVQIGRR